MPLARLLRDAVVREMRPGQPLASVVANRLVSREALGASNAMVLMRWDQDEGRMVTYARHGRSRYGTHCYR